MYSNMQLWLGHFLTYYYTKGWSENESCFIKKEKNISAAHCRCHQQGDYGFHGVRLYVNLFVGLFSGWLVVNTTA